MPLSAGDKLGPYEIVAPIGAGGMGEVYRAHDTRLRREVAIKVSAEHFSERFEKEARAIASLNHPNVCTLHDVGPNYLVMELVEGQTLAERIAQGPIPLDEALAIARQIADALDAAHEKGITHRDLKPANINIKPDGTVKVLDFGLAKMAQASPGGSPENSPTLTIGVTQAGVIMGTAAYMSPEQARGKAVDKRADIWAFGAVLHEMLTGTQLYAGETITDILAAVVTREPDWSSIPPSVRRLLRKCLEKDARRRLRDIGDAMLLLDDSPSPAEAPRQIETRSSKIWPWGSGILAAALLLLAFVHFREKPPEKQVMRSIVAAPEKMSRRSVVVSPDGRKLTLVAPGAGGKDELWVRSLDAAESRPLAGTSDAFLPFWSPDSRSLGFFAAGKLKRVDVSGGLTLTLADAPFGRGGTWSPDGVILFAPNIAGPVQRIAAGGGAASPVTKIGDGETTHRWPQFLPDGRHFLYAGGKVGGDHVVIHAADISSSESKIVGQADSQAIFSPGGAAGQLLFVHDATLVAQPFDPRNLAASGDAIPIAENIERVPTFAFAEFSVSQNGLLLYQTGGQAAGLNLVWFDRTGKRLHSLGEPADFGGFRLSPNGQRVAVTVYDKAGGRDIWLMDGQRGVVTRLSSNGVSENPIWSPDGRNVLFSSGTPVNLFIKESSGAGGERRVSTSPHTQYGNDWSRDGRSIVFDETVSGAGGPRSERQNDLFLLPLTPSGQPLATKPYLSTRFDEWEARLSPEPNPHWVSYRSNETGRYEVYVQAFPEPRGKTRISIDGGRFATWGPGGRELFYLSPENKLMAVPLKLQGDSVQPSAPQELFTLPLVQGNPYPYDVTPDGQRFLVRAPLEGPAGPLNMIVNWQGLLK